MHEKLQKLHEKKKRNRNIGLPIPCKWVFRLKSPDFMKSAWNLVDFMKSGGFHVKFTQNLVKAGVSTKTIQFDECRRAGFHEIWGHSPLHAPPKLKSFCWNIWLYKVVGGFQVKSAGFHKIRQISREIRRISWMWAFGWWSSVGLSFERPNSNSIMHYNLIPKILNQEWQTFTYPENIIMWS